MDNQKIDFGSLRANMIKAWGLEELPPEEQEKMVAELGELLYKSIVMKTADQLSEEDQNTLGELMEKNPQDGGIVLDFLREHVGDFDALAALEVAALKKQFVFEA